MRWDNFFNRLSSEILIEQKKKKKQKIVIQTIDRYPLKITKINNLSVVKRNFR